jgi:hypothetical protein
MSCEMYYNDYRALGSTPRSFRHLGHWYRENKYVLAITRISTTTTLTIRTRYHQQLA